MALARGLLCQLRPPTVQASTWAMWAFGHYLTDDAQGAHVLEHRQGVPTWGGGRLGIYIGDPVRVSPYQWQRDLVTALNLDAVQGSRRCNSVQEFTHTLGLVCVNSGSCGCLCGEASGEHGESLTTEGHYG